MDLVKIGRIGKTHGFKGELKMNVEDRYFDDVMAVDSLMIKLGGQPLPYFIKSLRGESALILKLEDINDKETASALQFLDVFLPKTHISEANAQWEDQSIFMTWNGYTIIDESLGEIGKIDHVHELPDHYLASIKTTEKEVIIPLHFDLITDVNASQKRVTMQLPEGILELN